MREWKVSLKGELWSDRFDSEELANAAVEGYINDGYGSGQDFTVEEMTEDEINGYDWYLMED